MASIVGICNRALQKLGSQAIVSLTENTRNARSVNRAYDSVRRAELENHPWAFATKHASLAADAPSPQWGRQNAFTLPVDFVRLLTDYPEYLSNADDYQIEDGKIITNQDAPLKIRYTSDVTDVSKFTPLFCEVLSCKLAVEMAAEITQSAGISTEVNDQYEKEIRKAKKQNAFQSRPAQAPDDTWITARN
jgi:hypothetical protein